MDTTIEKSSAHIRIDSGILEQLKAEAKSENRSLSSYLEMILYRVGYKPSAREVITPELQSKIDQSREQIRNGDCTVIRSREELHAYLESL